MPKPLLPVTHHLQRYPADCLAACAAMVLDYFGRLVAPQIVPVGDFDLAWEGRDHFYAVLQPSTS